MKILLFLVVVGVALWMFKSRLRGGAPRSDEPDSGKPPATGAAKPGPTPMLSCAHCGVHLPQADTVAGADGKPYCSEAHRLAGPR